MSETTSGARRISVPELKTEKHAVAPLPPRVAIEPVVGPAFVSVCASVLLGALIMSCILATGHMRPVPAYALFGSAFFGLTIAAFVVGAIQLAVTDSRRHGDDEHD